MKAVISDTSPINYLILISEIDLLPSMFGSVLIPPAVLKELRSHGAPFGVRTWAANLPAWVRVTTPTSIIPGLNVDPGETEAISLAKDYTDSLLIIDDYKGRKVASHVGLLTAGLLNVLEDADRRGLVIFADAVAKLRATNFRIHEEVLAEFFRRVLTLKSNKA
jgi:predicted nucleic acid-binding protein